MTSTTVTTGTRLVDRRQAADGTSPGGVERRQFANSYGDLQPEVRELALILDVELPSRLTLSGLRQNRTPHRESGREVSRG